MLVQPTQSLTDLLLGMVAVTLAVRLRRVPAAPRHWRTAFWWAGVGALAGAVHHGVLVRWPDAARMSWAVISVMVVVTVSYLLAGTVAEVLGPGRARAFWMLRSLGLVAYLALAAAGHAGVTAMLACESLTMLSVLVLWAIAAHRRHPLAGPVLLAILACGVAASMRAVGGPVTGRIGLDPNSAYHLGQIAGLLLLYRAVGTRREPAPPDPAPDPA